MVKGMLLKKSIRDMRKSKAQFISIFIMATIAVSIVTGLDSIWKTIQVHSEAMYETTNMSDLWVSVMNPTEKELWGVSRATGVEKVEKRFTVNAETDLENAPILRVYTISDQSTLDQPELLEGSLKSSSGAILDSTFAVAHGLEIGDRISIKLNDKWMSFTIDGLSLSSEQINLSKGSAGALPSHENFGFVFINESVLKGAYGQKVYNQICVKLSPGADIKQAEKEISDAVGDGLIGITARDDNASVSSVNAFIQQFKTLASVFPLLFFLVTALITQSTMVRLVESQRTEIGILKALGYTKKSILWHYTSYGIYIGLLGAVLGLLLGPQFFGGILVPRLRLTFSDYMLSINYSNFMVSLFLILLCTGGISLYSCLRLLDETPALLLREKPPKKGSHIFLEFIPKLWNRMKFSSKLIARNTIKNKVRLIMSILGITGCAGLIVGAFAISHMISGVAEQVYGNTYLYDQKVILSEQADTYLIRNERLNGTVQEIKEVSASIICPDGTQVMKQLTVLTKESPLVKLEDEAGNPVQLTDNGIAITRKLAETLNVKVGDNIQLKRSNEGYVPVPVNQVIYMAAGQGIFLTDTYYESIGETFEPTSILVKWNGSPDEVFLNSDYVEEYVDRDEQMADVASNTRVVNIASVMMILMGAILAFVVLYNSSVLNYAERIRDLATLQVLGFYQNEIRALVLTENFLSVFFGIIFGMPLGKVIVRTVAGGLDDRLDLIGHITAGNVLISALLTLIFALIVNSVVAKKMKNLDMLEALKSVE